MSQTISTARLEARISAGLHTILKRAAELQGRTMTAEADTSLGARFRSPQHALAC